MTLFPPSVFPWSLPVRVEEDPEGGSATLCDADGEVIVEDLDIDAAEGAATAINNYSEILTHATVLAEWADARDPQAPTSRIKELIEASCFSRSRRWTLRAQPNDLVRLDGTEWLVRRAWLDENEVWQVQLSPLVEGAPDDTAGRTVGQSGSPRCPLLVVGRMKAVYVRTA